MPLGVEVVSSVSLSSARRSGTEPSVLDSDEGTVLPGASLSDLRGERIDVGLVMGGGDRSLGLTGHRGAFLSSPPVVILCGMGVLRAVGSDDVYASTGIGVAESFRDVVDDDDEAGGCDGADVLLTDAGRDGTSSCILFCLDREPVTRPEAL